MAEPTQPLEYDPRGLIREAYRIEGIGPGQCRSIFLDWLLQAPDDPAIGLQIGALLAGYGAAAPDHPMSVVLRAGLAGSIPPAPRRRGGWRGRRAGGTGGDSQRR